MKKGWETKKLGDVCSFLNRGVSPKYVENGGIVVLNQRCVRDHRVNYQLARRHDIQAKSVNPERFVQAGDVLVNSTGEGTLGRVAQLREPPPEPTTVDSHVTIVRPAPGVFFTEFFGYVLRDIEEELQASGEGCGGQTELNRSVLADKFVVRFPTALSEQQRIVGVLDEAFAGLATAQAHAAQNLQNARALFESHLQSVFTHRGKGWVDRKLHSLCREITVGYVGPMAKEYTASGVTFLRSQNIRPFQVSLDNALFISREFDAKIAKSRLRPGDVAVVRTGYPGTAAVIPASLPESNCADLVIVRPGSEVEPQFLAAFFNSAYGKDHVAGKVVGAAQKHFNVGAAKETVLHLPPLKEQRTIIAKFDALAAETQRLTRLYEQKQAALAALKKSLLHQAFTGAL
jgi:type I restriction enzyme S subunit